MITQVRSNESWTDTLKSHKNHLITLLKIVDINTGKATKVELLTINLIKAEISLVESQLKGRN
jgi:hypothetical protein